jgi:3,4-dihydroxy 2-butanone 4-phosphate synthase/GTP cyclohydrolase II
LLSAGHKLSFIHLFSTQSLPYTASRPFTPTAFTAHRPNVGRSFVQTPDQRRGIPPLIAPAERAGPGFSRLDDALEALSLGLPVIVLDSEDRENEGDFVVAAEKITPQIIHFLITHGRGQVCMPVTAHTAERLGLAPMVAAKGADAPNFTVPVDHCRCKTGISPVDRCATIQAIVDEESRPQDFLRPGHMFPLVAREGGVLVRQGHTEASVDLVRMAGLYPAAVLCEICSSDGLHMATRDELLHLASDSSIPIVTIDALIEHRQAEAAREQVQARRRKVQAARLA